MAAQDAGSSSQNIVELNIGGTLYTSTMATLTQQPKSRLAAAVRAYTANGEVPADAAPFTRDSQGRMFLDRDGATFRLILDFLRNPLAPCQERLLSSAADRQRARAEAEFFALEDLLALLKRLDKKAAFQSAGEGEPPKPYFPRLYQGPSPITQTEPIGRSLDRMHSTGSLTQNRPFFITLGYRSSCSATRDCSSLEKFRRITRITVSGRSDIAKEVFRDDLNDSRDPDRYPSDGYTCRYYLKHNYLEHAFETLACRGFELVSSNSSGSKTLPAQAKEYKQWTTYTEHVFCRAPWDE